MRLIANLSINLGKIQGKIVNLKKGNVVELELTPEVKQIISSGILSKEGTERIAIDELGKFTNIRGIGIELGNLLISQYKTFENFKDKITEKKLEALPGISKEGAKRIYELISIEK